MINAIVKLLLSLSLSGSILAVLIFATKPFVVKKLSKSIQYYIWIVVILRLTLPFSFETSIMNELFYSNETPVVTSTQGEVQPIGGAGQNIIKSNLLPAAEETVSNGIYNDKQGINFKKLFNQYSLYLWLVGVIITLAFNLIGYARFLIYLKKFNILASHRENEMLVALLNGKNKVRLARNRFLDTPMLIGIARPCIIIPDISFSETQLKNILLHEIVHFKRFDIGVKWLILIATSIHWFNPLMYFIRVDILNSCELACDEAVIKNLTPAEKQEYGDTLISVVAEHKYPTGIFEAMGEEKKGLKERLVAIMNHSRKSKKMKIVSVLLLGVVIFGALYLGAGVGSRKAIPSDVQKNTEGAKMLLYNLKEISKYKTPYVGDNGKVSAIVNNLPVPNGYFVQQYISMITDKTPYNLNVYYEPKEEAFGEWQILSGDKVTFSNMSKNALVLFSMIDNLDGVSFAFRGTGSEGKLDASKYNYTYSFEREPFEKKYGKLSVIGGKLDLLQEALTADLNTVGMDIQTPTNEEIERYLEKIMSSPRTSSSPNDYIKAHENEYQSIIKMGDVALNYLLAQFKNTSNNSDLKGYIMMGLCKELLGERNNVKDEKLSPKEWFSKLAPYAEIKLSDAKTKVSNLIEQIVYDTAVKKYSVANNGFTVVAPTIFGSYEEGNKLKVFVTVFSSSYSLYDKTLSEVSGSVVPAAITFTKNAEGGYTLDEYLESMDGSYWLPSIKKYCIMPVSHKQIKGLSNKILKDYGSNVNRSELLMKNLIEHLKSNNKTGIVLKRRTGELVPLT